MKRTKFPTALNGQAMSCDRSWWSNDLPSSCSQKSAKLNTAYKRDFVNVGCDLVFDVGGPTVHSATVLGYKGWLAGYQVAFDTAKSRLTMNNFSLGYKARDFQLHTSVWVSCDTSYYAVSILFCLFIYCGRVHLVPGPWIPIMGEKMRQKHSIKMLYWFNFF